MRLPSLLSLLFLMSATTFYSHANLLLAQTYGDWEQYQSENKQSNETVVIGVTEAKSDGQARTVAMRCTNEGVNLLFFKSFDYSPRGYQAKGRLNTGENLYFDVWVKGTTHWATIPQEHIDMLSESKYVDVTLIGDNSVSERLEISMKGFKPMYNKLIASCQ